MSTGTASRFGPLEKVRFQIALAALVHEAADKVTPTDIVGALVGFAASVAKGSRIEWSAGDTMQAWLRAWSMTDEGQ